MTAARQQISVMFQQLYGIPCFNKYLYHLTCPHFLTFLNKYWVILIIQTICPHLMLNICNLITIQELTVSTYSTCLYLVPYISHWTDRRLYLYLVPYISHWTDRRLYLYLVDYISNWADRRLYLYLVHYISNWTDRRLYLYLVHYISNWTDRRPSFFKMVIKSNYLCTT